MDLPSWAPTAIGSVAAVCTTGAFVPQVVRVWRLKRADEISLATFTAFSVGTFVWLVYGIVIDSLPVVAANAVTFGLALAIVVLKLNFDRAARRRGE
jgi:MtN3 and saliva related transmembrane protein